MNSRTVFALLASLFVLIQDQTTTTTEAFPSTASASSSSRDGGSGGTHNWTRSYEYDEEISGFNSTEASDGFNSSLVDGDATEFDQESLFSDRVDADSIDDYYYTDEDEEQPAEFIDVDDGDVDLTDGSGIATSVLPPPQPVLSTTTKTTASTSRPPRTTTTLRTTSTRDQVTDVEETAEEVQLSELDLSSLDKSAFFRLHGMDGHDVVENQTIRADIDEDELRKLFAEAKMNQDNGPEQVLLAVEQPQVPASNASAVTLTEASDDDDSQVDGIGEDKQEMNGEGSDPADAEVARQEETAGPARHLEEVPTDPVVEDMVGGVFRLDYERPESTSDEEAAAASNQVELPEAIGEEGDALQRQEGHSQSPLLTPSTPEHHQTHEAETKVDRPVERNETDAAPLLNQTVSGDGDSGDRQAQVVAIDDSESVVPEIDEVRTSEESPKGDDVVEVEVQTSEESPKGDDVVEVEVRTSEESPKGDDVVEVKPAETVQKADNIVVEQSPPPPQAPVRPCNTTVCLRVQASLQRVAENASDVCRALESNEVAPKFDLPPYAHRWNIREKLRYDSYTSASHLLESEGTSFSDRARDVGTVQFMAKSAYDACVDQPDIERRGHADYVSKLRKKNFPMARSKWRRATHDSPSENMRWNLEKIGFTGLMDVALTTAGKSYYASSPPQETPRESDYNGTVKSSSPPQKIAGESNRTVVSLSLSPTFPTYLASLKGEQDRDYSDENRTNRMGYLCRLSAMLSSDDKAFPNGDEMKDKEVADLPRMLQPFKLVSQEGYQGRGRRSITDTLRLLEKTDEKEDDETTEDACLGIGDDRKKDIEKLMAAEERVDDLIFRLKDKPAVEFATFADLNTSRFFDFRVILDPLVGQGLDLGAETTSYVVDAPLAALIYQSENSDGSFLEDLEETSNVINLSVLTLLMDSMPSKYRDLWDGLIREQTGTSRRECPRKMTCGKFVVHNFELLMAHALYNEQPSRRDERGLEALDRSVKSVVIQANDTDLHKVDKPAWLYDDTVLEEYYADLNSSAVGSGSHVGNAIEFTRFRANKDRGLTALAIDEMTKHLFLTSRPGLLDVTSLVPNSLSDLPRFAEFHPLFYSGASPVFANLGGVGFLKLLRRTADAEKAAEALAAAARATPDPLATLPQFEGADAGQMALLAALRAWCVGAVAEDAPPSSLHEDYSEWRMAVAASGGKRHLPGIDNDEDKWAKICEAVKEVAAKEWGCRTEGT